MKKLIFFQYSQVKNRINEMKRTGTMRQMLTEFEWLLTNHDVQSGLVSKVYDMLLKRIKGSG